MSLSLLHLTTFPKQPDGRSVWGDIPKESYQRISQFLTKQERKIYLDDEYNKDGIVDGWWNGNDEREIKKFIKVIEISERRFLEQESLFYKIENSSEVKELSNYAFDVLKMIESGGSNLNNFKYIPQKSIDDISLKWFKAAEKVLLNKEGILNKNTVKLLAADAWRQIILKQHSIRQVL